MIKAQTFSATPTPADAVTPMALTMANIIRNDTLTSRSCRAMGAPSPAMRRRVLPWRRMSVRCISKGSSFLRMAASDTTTLTTWAATVAMAAPAVPRPSAAQSSRSPAMLHTQAMASRLYVNSGACVSVLFIV